MAIGDAPKPNTLENPARLSVSLDYGFSPEILTEYFKGNNECAFVVGKDGGIILGINHLDMTNGSQGSDYWVNDGYIRNKRSPKHKIFYSGSWSLSSQRLYTTLNTADLRRAIGVKVMEYLESIGVNTK